MATNNKPATTLRRGIVKATILENTSKNGPFFSTTFRQVIQGTIGHMEQRYLIRSE